MNKIITAGCMAVATFAAVAVPTKTELERAKPVVENMTKADLAAYRAGEKTAQKVAAAHIAYARKTEEEAAKYLLLQGAFKLYARSGEYDLAADTIVAMNREIKDLPSEVIVEIVSDELRYVSDGKARRLAAMLKEAKSAKSVDAASRRVKDRTTIQSIIDGMIKVPGKDYWLSETELTQGQWESVMGYNLSAHKGANLPVENVSRDDCDVFIEKLNQAKEVQASQFEFAVPTCGEWSYAAQAGGSGLRDYWIKPGVAGNLLDMAWLKDNSSNQTHAVATKAPNAFGFYDMQGNVSEWLLKGYNNEELGTRKGCSFREASGDCNGCASDWLWYGISRNLRLDNYGLRVAAHIRSNNASTSARPQVRGSLLARRKGMEDTTHLQATIDGYTWSYRVDNGEATIEAKKDGKCGCAVSPNPTGDITIPSMLNGVKVTGIGQEAFCHYCGPKSVKIPEGVKSIGWCAFYRCNNLVSATLPSSLKNIGHGAFSECSGLTDITIPAGVTNIDSYAFLACGGLKSITIPAGVKSIKEHAFDLCCGLMDIAIPENVESIGPQAFFNCRCLKSVTISSNLKNMDHHAFANCEVLDRVAMLGECPKTSEDIFKNCPKLTEIHVPANAKSWAGMKDWQGRKLVFDVKEK